MHIAQLSERFFHSKIDIVEPKKSKGLTKQEAAQKLKTDGKNALSPPKTISNMELFVRQFKSVYYLFKF